MKLLALDTSTEACSVALNLDGNITESFAILPQQHSHKLLYMIDTLLKQNSVTLSDLDALSFGRGPGSFTGLRIAAAVTQSIAFAQDIPVIPISTLRVLAQQAYEELHATHILAAIDARMNEIYWSTYTVDNNTIITLSEETVSAPINVIPPDEQIHWLGIGTGWHYHEQLKHINTKQFHSEHYPKAYYLAKQAEQDFRNGNMISPEEAQPIYLRNQIAHKKNT